MKEKGVIWYNRFRLFYIKIVSSPLRMFKGSITNSGPNHLPHDSRYDVKTTMLKKGVVNEGEK